jgi:sarcosine oxidase
MLADVVVVGGGLSGSAAAWELSRRGREVVLLEAFEPGHWRGSSHGSARIFRRAYSDPFYVRLTGAAGNLWRQLSDEADEELLRVTGAVDFGGSPIPADMHALLTAQQVPAELLTAAEAGERWPGIVFDGSDPVMFHPEGGVIDPDRAMAAMLRLATAHGALIKHSTPAIRIEASGVGAIVHTAEGSFEAPVIVVAAGAWLEPLLGGLVRLPRLEVTQMQAFHLAARAGQARAGEARAGEADTRAAEAWPVFICYDEPVVYGLVSGSDFPGAVKVGVHGQGTITTGDDRDGVVNPVVREQVRQFVLSKVPGLSPEPKAELTCLYTSTPSKDFILDRQGPFVVCSPCSGHGAKFAPLIGAVTADLVTGEEQPEPRFTLAAHIQ